MKTMRFLLPALLAASAGCFTLPQAWPPERPLSGPAHAVPSGPITPEQVNELNAHEKAKALREEIERDAHGEPVVPLPTAAAAAPKPSKSQ